MKYSLKKLVIVLSIACLIAFLVGDYVNGPERRARLVGINYNSNYRGGNFLVLPKGIDFVDDTLAEVVKIAADFSKPHSIRISGSEVTDDGFKIFDQARNIGGIYRNRHDRLGFSVAISR